MIQLIGVGVLLGALMGGLLAFAPRVSEWLVRSRARRLPPSLSQRMEEEWLAELDVLPGRPAQLAFAIALTLTRRQSFAMDEENLLATSSRSSLTATIGGWPSVVAVTTMAFAGLAYAGSFFIPPMYRSTARILVVPPAIPEELVKAAVRMPWQERLQRIGERVLSRTSLERVLLDVPYDPADPTAGPQGRVSASVLERMRRDVEVRIRPDGLSFEVGYQSSDPRAAQQVAERLASLYIAINIDDWARVTNSSSRFFEAYIDEVRSRLLRQTAEMVAAGDLDAVEAEVARLEHEQLKEAYRRLLMDEQRLLMSVTLERRQLGERFSVIDRPRLPEAPISPNRPLIAGEGAAAGLFLSVMMMAGRNGTVRRLGKALARS